MKGLLIIFFCLLFSAGSFSQTGKAIDSLSLVLMKHYDDKKHGKKIADTTFIFTLNLLSYEYFKAGNFDSSFYFTERVEELSLQCQFTKGRAYAAVRQGHIYYEQGDFPKAIESYQKALLIYVDVEDRPEQGVALGSISSVYTELGNYERAMYYSLEAVKIFELLGDEKNLLATYVNIASIYVAQKDYNKALEYMLVFLPLQEKTGDKIGLAKVLNNIGAIYTNQGNFESGAIYFERALALKEEIGDLKSIVPTTCSLGSFYFNQENYTRAIELYLRSYNLAKEMNLRKWLKISSYGLFRAYYWIKDYSSSEKFGLEILEMNKLAVSINFPVSTEFEKELFFKTIALDFEKFNSLALIRQLENPAITETVYNTTLTYKGLLLKSSTAMRNAILNSGDKSLIKDYDEWIDIKKQIAKSYSTGNNFSLLEERADSIEKELVRKSNVFSDFEKNQNTTWKDVQNGLKTNEAAIEFIHFLHNDDTSEYRIYCALIIKPESKFPEMIELFRETKLEEILGTFQGNNLKYVNSVYGIRNEKNTALYDLIWKPMENSLKGINQVYISPTGLLHKISFAALCKEQNVYLCDNYSIQMVASTEKVARPEIFIFDNHTSATIFGGINYSTDSSEREIWNYLEGTEIETQKIASLFTKKNLDNQFFTNTFATESEFKNLASKSNILHIATHGFFYPDPNEVVAELEIDSTENGDIKFRGRGFGYSTFVENENPLMRSGLVFAGANDVWSTQNTDGEDGVLTAQEVAHIDMRNTQLVVLSACETGLGDIKGSEGVYGLQRAFKMAGVKFIIMSLWQVPDKETAEFMTLFYKRLIKLKDIHLAFNQTQKAMRAKYDPYYWAAFVLIE